MTETWMWHTQIWRLSSVYISTDRLNSMLDYVSLHSVLVYVDCLFCCSSTRTHTCICCVRCSRECHAGRRGEEVRRWAAPQPSSCHLYPVMKRAGVRPTATEMPSPVSVPSSCYNNLYNNYGTRGRVEFNLKSLTLNDLYINWGSKPNRSDAEDWGNQLHYYASKWHEFNCDNISHFFTVFFLYKISKCTIGELKRQPSKTWKDVLCCLYMYILYFIWN